VTSPSVPSFPSVSWRRGLLGALAASSILLLTACEATVLALVVDSKADAADANPGDGVCETSAGECTLRAAIQEANATDGRVEITLAPGAYPRTALGLGEDAAATGDLDITGNVVLHGQGAFVSASLHDRLFDVHPGGRLVVDRIGLNSGSATIGGAFYVRADGQLTILHAEVYNNRATQPTFCGPGVGCQGLSGGGAIYNAGELSVAHSTIRDNKLERLSLGFPFPPPPLGCDPSGFCEFFWGGGGVYNEGSANFVNVTFSRNQAPAPGGAIYDVSTDTLVAFSTFVDNVGGGYPSGLPFTGDGRALAGNMQVAASVLTGAAPQCSPTVGLVGSPPPPGPASAGYNVATDGTCGSSPTDLPAASDVGLGALADNGGPTETHLPSGTSPVVDAIPASEPLCLLLTIDQRGEARPSGAGCDIGAVERQPTD
jgi:CSLREA domain-containing protein